MSRQESASDHGKMTDPKERPPADSAYARAIRDILATPKTQKPRRFDAWATASKDAQSKTEQKSTSNVQADQAAKQAGRRDEKPFDPDQTPARFKFDNTIR
ncbi:hypothetical protein CKAH01_16722 [Colletotrichum kahawae]|uniref:Uncharacterized protein n=1 Tax=Colletotrichum kahawae TaxID=34407 RepID=A0AAD9YEP1_COLKA|nr:hypothetical protein CKAH01_16722 [Colletotrichum kahawae]